jgi:hypothetical protein
VRPLGIEADDGLCEWVDYGDARMFVVGYTAGGVPYGWVEGTDGSWLNSTITRSPKSHSSSIRRSDLSTAAVDKSVPTIGLAVPGSETDRGLSLSSGTGTHGPESSLADRT